MHILTIVEQFVSRSSSTQENHITSVCMKILLNASNPGRAYFADPTEKNQNARTTGSGYRWSFGVAEVAVLLEADSSRPERQMPILRLYDRFALKDCRRRRGS